MATADPREPFAAGAGGTPAQDRFVEFFDFLVEWGPRVGRSGNAPEEFWDEIFTRWVLPEMVAGGASPSLPAGADSSFGEAAILSALPPWFRSRVQALLEPPPVYDFLLAPAGPDEIGRLGGYRILRVLGTGGMGVVFE